MARKRRNYSGKFKTQVALEAIKEVRTISELASEYEVHPNQITNWKKQLVEGADQIFNGKKHKANTKGNEAKLYEEIGRLKVELDWLKKKSGL